MRAVWEDLRPLWRRASPLLRQEQERIGLARVTDSLDTVLDSLGGRVRYADGAFRLPHPCPRQLTDLGRRRVVLVPLASGYTAGTYSAERDDVLRIGYPCRDCTGWSPPPRPSRTPTASPSCSAAPAPASCATPAGAPPRRTRHGTWASPSARPRTTATS
ncbi:hypothetical protein [Streptomyces sp. Tu 3180]|uniref:hypothetical protein n=1 Tax=Streptomyces sp. Tu 3180 TaxID=2682611 RepID=UPI0032602B13